MEHLTRCVAVMQAINLHPDSYLLPTPLLTLLRNAIYDTNCHFPTPEMVADADKIFERLKQDKEWDNANEM